MNITERQAQILDLVSQGLTYAQIGRKLSVSVTAISSTMSKAYANLGADSAAHAVRIGFEIGLLGERTFRVQEEVAALADELCRAYKALVEANAELASRPEAGRAVQPHWFGEYLLKSVA